ncbi:hypothetical protein ACVWWK_003841 [Bradyrhizobium sp. LB9.1b]
MLPAMPRRIADQASDPLGMKRSRHQMPIAAGPAVEHVEPRQQPECVGVVPVRFRDLQPAPERDLGLLVVALREHECVAKRRLKLELPSAAPVGIVEHRECAIGPDAGLAEQIELDEQPCAAGSERHAQAGAVVIRITPLQRRAGVGEQARALLQTGCMIGASLIRHARFERAF